MARPAQPPTEGNLARKYEDEEDASPSQAEMQPQPARPRFALIEGGNEGDDQPVGQLSLVENSERAEKSAAAGRRVATVLVFTWIGLAAFTLFFGFGIGGIPAFIILNLLLISPRLVYRLSEVILDFVGVGEALQTMDALTPGKTRVVLSGWHKGVIIFFDMIVFAIAVMVFAIFVGVFCKVATAGGDNFLSNAISWTVSRGADLFTGSNGFSAIRDACLNLGKDVEGLAPSVSFTVNSGINTGSIPGKAQCAFKTGVGGVSCSAGCDRGDTVACVNTYDADISRAAAANNIDPNMIRAVIQQESRWHPSSASGAGAQGIMQILRSTWNGNRCSGDPFNASDSIACGAKVLNSTRAYLVSKYGPTIGNDWRYILAGYNGGFSPAFDKSTACSGQFYWECSFATSSQNSCATNGYKETRDYAVSVLRYYNDYKAGACNK